MSRLLAMGAFFLASLPISALAAPQLPGGLTIPNVEYNPLLLINQQVQTELKMSPAVKSKVTQAFYQQATQLAPVAMGGNGPGGRPLTTAQRNAALYRGIDKMQASLAAMLNPTQRLRLRQLTLQSIGPSAVLQPKVATALGLSKSQKSRLEGAIGAANARVANDLTNNRTSSTMQRRLAQMAKLQAQAKAEGNKALVATLTQPQRAKWNAMLGKPFNLSGFLGIGSLSQVAGMGG